MDPRQWQKLKKWFWLAVFAGLTCLGLAAAVLIIRSFIVAVLEIR